MESKNSYFIVGVFFCIVLIFGLIFLLFMNKSGNEEDYESYFVRAKELPNGLKRDANVRFIGVPVGMVKDIYFADPQTATIEIKLNIKKDLPIKKDSVATVEIQGISGIASINISKGEGESFAPNEKKIIPLEQSLLAKIGNNAENLSKSIKSTLERIELILSDKNIEAISRVILGFENLTNTIASPQNLDSINRSISDINEITSKFKIIQNKINSNLNSGEYDLKTTLQPTLKNLNETLFEFKMLLNQFQSTLFRLEDNPYEFFFKDTGEKK